MFTQPTNQLVQWQDFKVISEVNLVLEIAQQNGWKDCEIFGYGDMITQPMQSMGWNLIPADLYEYSIPAVGVDRILQINSAGVRIKGVIIADDQRKINPAPTPKKSVLALSSARTIFSFIGKALHGYTAVISIIGKVLLRLTIVAILVRVFIYAPWLILGTALILGTVFILSRLMPMDYDPKLIILVDDGNGGVTWISVLTWFD